MFLALSLPWFCDKSMFRGSAAKGTSHVANATRATHCIGLLTGRRCWQSLLAEAVAAVDAGTPGEGHEDGDSLHALCNGRVNAKLLRVFEHLAEKTGVAAAAGESCDRFAARAVASRCAECLPDMKTSLAEDLAELASQNDETVPYNVELYKFLQRQHKLCLQKLEAAGELPPSLVNEEEAAAAIDRSDSAELSGPRSLALQFRCYKKLLLWATIAELGPVVVDMQNLLARESQS